MRELISNFSREKYDGVIFIEQYADWQERLIKHGVPAVIANNEFAEGAASCGVNFRMVGRMAGQEFVKRGYRHVAFLGSANEYAVDEIAAGLRGAMAEAKIWLSDEDVYIFAYYWQALEQITEFKWTLKQALLDKARRPEAFLVFRYPRALILLQLLDDLGIRVPEDMGILVYDAPSARDQRLMTLSMLKEPVEELGKKAVDMLYDWNCDLPFPRRTILLPEMVDNGSL